MYEPPCSETRHRVQYQTCPVYKQFVPGLRLFLLMAAPDRRGPEVPLPGKEWKLHSIRVSKKGRLEGSACTYLAPGLGPAVMAKCALLENHYHCTLAPCVHVTTRKCRAQGHYTWHMSRHEKGMVLVYVDRQALCVGGGGGGWDNVAG